MRKTTIGLLFASILLVGAMSSPALYAQGGHVSSGSMMDHGMMDHGMIGMSRMMAHCGDMMHGGSGRPNEQWHDGQSPTPDDDHN